MMILALDTLSQIIRNPNISATRDNLVLLNRLNFLLRLFKRLRRADNKTGFPANSLDIFCIFWGR